MRVFLFAYASSVGYTELSSLRENKKSPAAIVEWDVEEGDGDGDGLTVTLGRGDGDGLTVTLGRGDGVGWIVGLIEGDALG